MASELQRGGFNLSDLQPIDKQQQAAAAAGGGTAGSGLVIDGFIVPPHVLQALQVGPRNWVGLHSMLGLLLSCV